MNNARRKIIRDVIEKIQTMERLREEVVELLIEVMDEEQEAYDNLPETFQMGERGEKMEEAISILADAVSEYEGLEFDASTLEDTL